MLSKICMVFKLDDPLKPKIRGFEQCHSLPFRPECAGLVRNAKVRRTVCDRFIKLCRSMTPELEAELARMPYGDFLNTDYWSYLRDYIVMAKGIRCETCHLTASIITDCMELHHTSYDHRGSEWRHMEDLKVLCRACHEQERQ